jgi:para-nitrobenzyl esterase
MIQLRGLILWVAAAFCFSSPAYAEQTPVVDALAGQLKGQTEGALQVFKGIPFALPPVGALRWRAPQPMPRWVGVREATAYGPTCIQPESKLSTIYTEPPAPMSEDCLTLNIWTPANAHNAPVFFWIYGGALVGGASREAIYDGAKLASRGVVVVTINYRVGVLGWLAHPDLSAESPLRISGNYGLLDQIQALHWVHDNIGAFGGDAANVTIAGESAGGLSVMYLMASPPARGLFAKAIAESAYMVSVPELHGAKFGMPADEDSGKAFAAAMQAPDIAALRTMDAMTLTNMAVKTGFVPWPTVDGRIIPEQLVDVFDKGEEAPVPILAGFNAGEIRSLRILAPPAPANAADYEKTIRAKYLDLADKFLALYPSTDLQESVLATTRDAMYGWTAERLVRKQTAQGEPSFLYLWDHSYPAADSAGLHAFHASELPFVFGNADRTASLWPKIPNTPAEAKLSDAMLDYWTSFARTGHPIAANEPDWPAFDSTNAYMHFMDTPHPSEHVTPGMYALHEEVVCRRRAVGDIAWNWNVGIISPPLPPQKAGCP